MTLGTLTLPSQTYPQVQGEENPWPSEGGARGPVSLPSRQADPIGPMPSDASRGQSGPVERAPKPNITIEVPLPDNSGMEGRLGLMWLTPDGGEDGSVMGWNDGGTAAYRPLPGAFDRGANAVSAAPREAVPSPVFRRYMRRGALRQMFGVGAERYPGVQLVDKRVLPQTRRLLVSGAQPQMNPPTHPLLTRWRRAPTYSSTQPVLVPDYSGGGNPYGAY